MPDLVESLTFYIRESNAPTLVKAALAHAQFETTHPFFDGNGPLGRLLVTLILQVEQVIMEPLLYLSLYFKQHRSSYYESLQRVRFDGHWEQWLRFFMQGVLEVSRQAVETASQLLALVYVSEADILAGFASVAEAIAFDTVIADQVAAQLEESHAAVRAQRRRDSDRFKRELAALLPKEDQLTELLMGGTLDDAAYKRQLQRIRDQRDELTRKLDEANERLDDEYISKAKATLELAKRAKLLWLEQSAHESVASSGSYFRTLSSMAKVSDMN